MNDVQHAQLENAAMTCKCQFSAGALAELASVLQYASCRIATRAKTCALEHARATLFASHNCC